MRYVLLITILCLLFITCKKDSTDSAPVITYKSVSPNFAHSSVPVGDQQLPVLTIHVKDADGDLGFVSGKDTSFIFIRNIVTGDMDSLPFPDLNGAAGKNFEGDVLVPLSSLLISDSAAIDTLHLQAYVKDFARQTSDTVTLDPVYYYTP
jgi:hypothetical protein